MPRYSSWLSKRVRADGRHETCVRDTAITLEQLLHWRRQGLSSRAMLDRAPELFEEDLLVAWDYLGLPAIGGKPAARAPGSDVIAFCRPACDLRCSGDWVSRSQSGT
jgi:hypothetical protein